MSGSGRLEVSPFEPIRQASDGKVREWLRRNQDAEYRRLCGEIHAALIADPGITFSRLAENLGKPCDAGVRGRLISLAHLGLVFKMEGAWWPRDPDEISGIRADVLGWAKP